MTKDNWGKHWRDEYEVPPKKEEVKVRNIKKRRGIQLLLAKLRHNGVRSLFNGRN